MSNINIFNKFNLLKEKNREIKLFKNDKRFTISAMGTGVVFKWKRKVWETTDPWRISL